MISSGPCKNIFNEVFCNKSKMLCVKCNGYEPRIPQDNPIFKEDNASIDDKGIFKGKKK